MGELLEVKDAKAPGATGPAERWHGWMALCSFAMFLFSIAAFNDGSIVGALFGLGLVSAVVVAAVFSRLWTRVKDLPPQRKAFVWAIAVIGAAIGSIAITFIYIAVKLHGWLRQSWR